MKIVVDVVNSEKVKQLTEEIKRQEQQILSWNAAMKGASSTQQAVLQTNMSNAGKTIANARTEIASLEAAGSGAGRGLSQLAYAIDDVQYGFNAIVNNIPQIVMGLGGGAGLAGAIGIAAVAINQLIKHWSELTAAMETAWTGGSYDQLLKIEEHAEAAADAYEKLAKAKNKWEEKSSKAVEEAITEEGTEKTRKQIADALLAGGHIEQAKIPDNPIESQLTGFGGHTRSSLTKSAELHAEDNPVAQAEARMRASIYIRRMEDKITQERSVKEAEKIMGGLQQGPEQAQKARDMINRLNKEGGLSDKITADINDTDPAVLKQEKEDADFQKHKKALEAKEDQINKQRWHERQVELREELKEEKDQRIGALEDEREEVNRKHRDFDEAMHKRMEVARQHGTILHGAKSATDYYQGGTRNEDTKKLQEEARVERRKMREALEEIVKEEKKVRKLEIPR